MRMPAVPAVPAGVVGVEVFRVGTRGALGIGAHELAARAGTIAYEVLCGVGARVPRRYAGA
jgi:alanine racemase